MSDSKKILVIGGDKRQRELCSLLKENNKDCQHISQSTDLANLESLVEASNVIILPLPVAKDNINIYSDDADMKISLDDFAEKVRSNQFVIGGMINESLKTKFNEKNVESFDFYSDEGFVTYNAFLTAQGAIYLLLKNTDEYVVSNKMLVAGFGRVGKAVSHFMKAIGVDVYVAARNDVQKSLAISYGYRAIDISDIKSTVRLFDYIINTVPFPIFTENEVKFMKDKCVFIELASEPFGAEKKDFEKYEKNFIAAASLPGKLYPAASAKAIFESIEKYL